MTVETHQRPVGAAAALLAALLFGAGTPLAKLLLDSVSPWLLAGLLYLGSGVGLTLYRLIVGSAPVRLPRREALWFAGAVLSGGIFAPILLLFGLSAMPASGASLLLNAEGLFTALLAWIVFKENFNRRIGLGMVAIIAGAAILSWPQDASFAGAWPALAILAACLAWGLDNNLTRKVSLTDAAWIASIKGLVAGSVNLCLAFALGATLPPAANIGGALLVGFFAYGLSLVMFVIGLRHLGAARTGAYFSVAPFFGVLLAVFMGDDFTLPLMTAGVLMAFGVWLHLSEKHRHEHVHEIMRHEHEHTHDEHHQHAHEPGTDVHEPHTHVHAHKPVRHTHEHFPDIHHRHVH